VLNRDGRESFVVTKVFDVECLKSDVAATAADDLDFIHEIPVAEVWLSWILLVLPASVCCDCNIYMYWQWALSECICYSGPILFYCTIVT